MHLNQNNSHVIFSVQTFRREAEASTCSFCLEWFKNDQLKIETRHYQGEWEEEGTLQGWWGAEIYLIPMTQTHRISLLVCKSKHRNYEYTRSETSVQHPWLYSSGSVLSKPDYIYVFSVQRAEQRRRKSLVSTRQHLSDLSRHSNTIRLFPCLLKGENSCIYCLVDIC